MASNPPNAVGLSAAVAGPAVKKQQKIGPYIVLDKIGSGNNLQIMVISK